MQYPYLVKEFAKQYFDPQIKRFILQNKNEDYEIVDEFKSKFPTEFVDFLDWSYNLLGKNEIEPIPTWYVMEYQGIVKNQWLIHFSNNAKNIWEEQKFKYGISDFDRLGYTTSYNLSAKEGSGFNFSYDIGDFEKYGRSSNKAGSWKYGKEAVLFKASGIKAYHYGDEEPQVIFDGKTAKDIVYLQNSGDWYVENKKINRIIYRAQTLPEVVKWVVNNFNQYKKVLLP